MNIIDTIKKRKSCRTFNNELLHPADKIELESFIIENSKCPDNEIISFRIFEKNAENKIMKLNYGTIVGHKTYLVGKSKSTLTSRVNYGYLMEKAVLKATEMNISTCWIGYFDSGYFTDIVTENGFEIPSIVILGYPEEKTTFFDKVTRYGVKASRRLSWNKLFFNYKLKTPLEQDSVNKYSDSLEMVRLAPSAGNTQPWRIYYDDIVNEFHFFKTPINKKYEEKGLHDIDMGIALCHFELTSLYNGLSGRWIKQNIDSRDDLQYIMTWRCE